MTHCSRRKVLQTTTLATAFLATERLAAAPLLRKIRKKGVCGGIHGTAGLAALNPAWFYTWNIRTKIQPPLGVEWLPQIFPHDRENIAKSCRIVKEDGHKILLGYNEPDHPGQGNISVETALKHWPDLMATGMRLISPGAAWAPRPWMKEFMRQADARKFRIDAVAIHWYSMPDPNAFLSYVENAYKDYGRPIWITEFGVNDKKATDANPTKVTPGEVIGFLKVVLPALEKLPWVERYCLYAPHHPKNPKNGTSCLFTEDGKLTEVGEYFAKLP
jgi:hypothetical protein